MANNRNTTIDFDALRYILAAAEFKKFSRAAKALGIETASLSRRVSRIEDELGLTLFERSHDGVRLTQGGKAVLVHVRRALFDLNAIISAGERNAQGQEGRINLGIRLPIMGSPLREMLERWRQANPGIVLTVHELSESDMVTAIDRRHIDIALLPKPMVWPRAMTIPIYRHRLVVALPRSHDLAQQKTLRWQDLRTQTVLVQGWDGSQTMRKVYAALLGNADNIVTHGVSKQTILALVAAGYGLALVTRAQAYGRVPGVVFRHIAEDNAEIEIQLAWAPENEETAVGRFIAFMRDESRKPLQHQSCGPSSP